MSDDKPDLSNTTPSLTSPKVDQTISIDKTDTRPLRVAINGFGRIGRNVLRAMIERFEVLGRSIHIVAINDLASTDILLHLLKNK